MIDLSNETIEKLFFEQTKFKIKANKDERIIAGTLPLISLEGAGLDYKIYYSYTKPSLTSELKYDGNYTNATRHFQNIPKYIYFTGTFDKLELSGLELSEVIEEFTVDTFSVVVEQITFSKGVLGV